MIVATKITLRFIKFLYEQKAENLSAYIDWNYGYPEKGLHQGLRPDFIFCIFQILNILQIRLYNMTLSPLIKNF
jgi:hypothetical protein